MEMTITTEVFRNLSKPFERAQLEARKAQGETTIYLRKGIYRLERPLIFTPEDGGKEKPLSIRAFRNEQVTLSGGKVLHPVWKPYKKRYPDSCSPRRHTSPGYAVE